MIHHYQKVEAVQKELANMNYVFPIALRWSIDDIDSTFDRIGQEMNLERKDKLELLEKFFDHNEEQLTNFINERLTDFIKYGTS